MRWARGADRGQFRVVSNRDKTVACVAWQDKGTVLLTCTASNTARAECIRGVAGQPRFPVQCPYVALDFMKYFQGVDRNDQMRTQHYSLLLTFKCSKWTVKFFLGMLDMVLVNTWVKEPLASSIDDWSLNNSKEMSALELPKRE